MYPVFIIVMLHKSLGLTVYYHKRTRRALTLQRKAYADHITFTQNSENTAYWKVKLGLQKSSSSPNFNTTAMDIFTL